MSDPEYAALAERCRFQARRATDQEVRTYWLLLAESWVLLAGQEVAPMDRSNHTEGAGSLAITCNRTV